METSHLSRGRRVATLLLLAAALSVPLLVAPDAGLASAKGPFPGFTGAPGEQTCRHCHDSYPLNTLGGNLLVDGFPESYAPNETYHVSVTLESASALRWGFEATVLGENDKHAGKLVVTDPLHTKVVRGFFIPDRTYVEQKRAGAFDDQRGSATWTFDWRAPKTDRGAVTLYVCGNAGNANGAMTGDYIYYKQVTANPAQ